MLDKTPFGVEFAIWRRKLFTCDLDNLLKAMLNAPIDIVFDDDRYLVHVRDAAKVRAAEEDFFLIRVWPIEEDTP